MIKKTHAPLPYNVINDQMLRYAHQSAAQYTADHITFTSTGLVHFVTLLQQHLVEQLKAEIISDTDIALEPDALIKEYLRGSNTGIIEAILMLENFNKDATR